MKYKFKLIRDGIYTHIEKLDIPIADKNLQDWQKDEYFSTLKTAKEALISYGRKEFYEWRLFIENAKKLTEDDI